MNAAAPPRLRPVGKRWRALYLVLLPGALFSLAFVQPGSLSHWSPFAVSCGAITGLPCIFCGTTRAIHQLLHGQFARVLYYNWLAFPILGGALALFLLHGLELLLDRDFLGRLPRPRTWRAVSTYPAGAWRRRCW